MNLQQILKDITSRGFKIEFKPERNTDNLEITLGKAYRKQFDLDNRVGCKVTPDFIERTEFLGHTLLDLELKYNETWPKK